MTTNGLAKNTADIISIHIPRVGDDVRARVNGGDGDNFNPHPPCGG